MSGGTRERLAGKRVCIVAGSGGVGKTTTSAALALGLAADGARVAVVTIDPARRLADALGLKGLRNTPERVDPARLDGHGVELRGELWAMTLDPKRTFDELIERLAPDARAREEILGNRIYQQLSSAVAGSQEFTAVAKLFELDREGGFDVLVLDTPPSRNALDFLDAPDRLTSFFDGRALRLLLTPTGLAARVMGRGTSVVFSVLRRLTGVDLLEDLRTFFGALSTVLDGLRERANGVKALLADPATTFLIVSSPQRDSVEEAIFFHEKLREAKMRFGGLIVNRVDPRVAAGSPGDDPDDARTRLAPVVGDTLARKVGRAVAEEQVLAARDRAAITRLQSALADPEPVLVPQLPGDVHDVDGLVAVWRHLFEDVRV